MTTTIASSPAAAPARWRSGLALLATACLGSVCAAPAWAADEALGRIAKTGRIVIGAHDAGWPANYIGPQGNHVGYHITICQRIVERVRQHLNLPEIKIATVPVTMATRMALLTNGTVDMDCGPNPINNSTLRQALLTHATLVDEQGFMITVEKPRYKLADLERKNVGLVTGGSSAALLRAAARKQNFAVNEVFARSGPELLGMLGDGRVDAVLGPLPLLMANRARSAEPARFVLLDVQLGRVYSAIMVGLGDEKLRALANEVIVSLARTGELTRLYAQWFTTGTNPGFTQPIGLAMSPAQAELFAEPGIEMQSL